MRDKLKEDKKRTEYEERKDDPELKPEESKIEETRTQNGKENREGRNVPKSLDVASTRNSKMDSTFRDMAEE